LTQAKGPTPGTPDHVAYHAPVCLQTASDQSIQGFAERCGLSVVDQRIAFCVAWFAGTFNLMQPISALERSQGQDPVARKPDVIAAADIG